MTRSKKKARVSADSVPKLDTRARLVEGATREFNDHGYFGTDSNRIARRAGFAPQTFYRWFTDKTEIFIAAYQSWEETERVMLGELLARRATTKQLAQAAVQHHADYRIFRRSLRQLSLDDPQVRSARAASRLRQIAQVKTWQGNSKIDEGRVAAALFQMERLADALAEGELSDMGLAPLAAERALAAIIDELRGAE